jgi:hypothetical protein
LDTRSGKTTSLLPRSGFDAVFEWRNSSLRGNASYPTISGTLLTLFFLIALDEVRDDYAQMRDSALRRVQMDLQTIQIGGSR